MINFSSITIGTHGSRVPIVASVDRNPYKRYTYWSAVLMIGPVEPALRRETAKLKLMRRQIYDRAFAAHRNTVVYTGIKKINIKTKDNPSF